MILSLFKNTDPQNQNLLLTGADTFLNDYVIKAYCRQKAFKTFEKVTIDCETSGLDSLIAAISESSLFSEQKLVIVKNPFFLTAKPQKAFKKALVQLTSLLSHATDLEEVLIFVASYDKLDRRKKITKLIINHCNVVDTTLHPYEVGSFFAKLSQLEQIKLNQPALQLLLERSDHVVDTVLANYIKLKTISDNHQLSSELVAQNTDLTLAQNIFEILTVALKGNLKQAATRLKDQLKEGVNPVQLLAVFETQLELLLCVKLLKQSHQNETQISQTLRLHPYRVKLALQNKTPLSQLKQLLKQAIDLEWGYKNGTYHDEPFILLYLLSIS